MKEQLRYCINEKCQQFEIPHTFQRGKRCNACGSKTRFIESVDDCPPQEYVDKRMDRQDDSRPLLLPVTSSSTRESEPMVFGAGTEVTDNKSDCDLNGCPIAPDSPVVCVPWDLYQKWIFLAHKLSVEWIAYLMGRFEEETDDKAAAYILDSSGMYFPNQSATGAHVDAETCDEKDGTIGSVHSHVEMKASFSSTDYDNFSRAVELVVNRAGEVSCVTRVKLMCGKYERVKAKVELIGATEMVSCLTDLKAKLIMREDKSAVVVKTIGPSAVVARPDEFKEPSNELIKAALKVLRRSQKFKTAEAANLRTRETLEYITEST